jgi:hypothetical protein
MNPCLSAPRWPSHGFPWVVPTLLGLLLWGGGVTGGLAQGGLIGYLEQTHDHRFEPWVGDDPSYSEDPLSALGPPLSPLALFPWMWQRHHPGDVVSRHTVELLEAAVVRPVPALQRAPGEGKRSRALNPWRTRRNVAETYRELVGDPPRESVAGTAGQDEAKGPGGETSSKADRRDRRTPPDDDADED